MQDYLEYLDSLGEEDKEFTSNFFKKKEYIEKLNETAINNCNDIVYSKIAVVIDKESNQEKCLRFIKPMLDSINISLWNVYVTSVKKNALESEMWSQMIQHELYAVSPSFTFMVCDDKPSFTEGVITCNGRDFNAMYLNIEDIDYVLDKDHFKDDRYNDVISNFYSCALKLIPFRDIE